MRGEPEARDPRSSRVATAGASFGTRRLRFRPTGTLLSYALLPSAHPRRALRC